MLKPFLRQLTILGMDEFKELFLRKRALFAIILYAVFLLFIIWLILGMRDFMISSIRENHDMDAIARQSMIYTLKNFKIPDEMIQKNPVLKLSFPLLVYFFVSLYIFPLLIPLISCDMISQDLSRGTQRFLLFRASREAYYFSKKLAHLFVYCLIQWSLFLCLFLGCVYYAPEILNWQFLIDAFYINSLMIPVSLMFLSLTQLISSLVKTALKSIIFYVLIMFGMAIILRYSPLLSIHNPDIWMNLISYDTSLVLKSVVYLCLWSLGFMVTGFTLFRYKKL